MRRFLAGCLMLAAFLLSAAVIGAEPEAASTETAGEPGRPLRRLRLEAGPVRFAPEELGAESPGNVRYTAAPRIPSIPGFEEALTQHYISRYSSPGGLAWLETVMRRGAPYLAFIRREIEERNLPWELIYLPVIESGFLATARSSSGAVGLWQFMRNSIAPFDMRVTDWLDERMDFWKSTQGALRKLEENYRILGDWPLALAAYNAGLGAINGIITRTGIRDYQTLSERRLLKAESIHYVPKLLAVAYILSNPRRFGLDMNWPEDPQWVRIAVGRMVDLDMLAATAGIDPGELKTMNRELHYNVTPSDSRYYLKARSTDAEALQAVLDREDLVLLRFYFHTIQYGDTLSVLAQHYGVSVDQINSANPGVEARYLKLGTRLRIPAFMDTGPYRASARRDSQAVPAFEGRHIVKRGETLWSIALTYDVDPLALAEANGMELRDTLREGRSLKTPILKTQDGLFPKGGRAAGE